jgi:hypothetical protein
MVCKQVRNALLAVALLAPLDARAQTADETAARAAVQSLFTAMLNRDTAAVRASMMPGAVIYNPIRRQAGLTQRIISIEAFNERILKTPQPYDERMPISDVRIDTDLANVWGRYTFRVGERVTNCGRNSITLVRTDAGWKITQFASTIETSGCEGMDSTSAPSPATDDRTLVRSAVEDYIEGFYQGDSTRLVRSIARDVYKYGYAFRQASGSYQGMQMTYEGFMSFARGVREGRNRPPANAPKEIVLYDVQDQIASAKVTAWWGIDYLLLAKREGQWWITHVTWQTPPKAN